VLLWTTIKMCLKSLLSNKMRSILAMLGIIIGVAAVIAMLALGSGAKKQVLERFQSMGSNLLVVMPGQRGSHGVMSGSQQNLTLDDAQAIAGEVVGAAMVAPAVNSGVQLKYYNKNTRSVVLGTSVTYFPIRSIELARGRTFTEGEVERMARVAVIGPTAAKNVFGENDPVGEVIKINRMNFTVIGLAKPKGEGPMSPDDRVIVPYSVAMQQLLGVDYLREIDIQVADDADMDVVQADLTALLRKRHRIQPNLDNDFNVMNMAEIREQVSATVNTFRALLGSIAAISLLVGGIGIMNIMLVSVTERTREIGVRKAIGAKERHILMQFLLESVIISGLGGLIGVGLGIGGAQIVPSLIEQLSSVVELPSVLLALSFAAGVGIFFGFYPAWRASMLDPIEALRYE